MEGNVNLVRLGHYFVPSGRRDDDGLPTGSCQTALVVGVNDINNVNLRVWQHDGDDMIRTAVKVGDPVHFAQVAEDALAGATPIAASFHLSGDCPWKR